MSTQGATVIHLDSRRPHDVGPVSCEFCGFEWVAVWPTGLPTRLECPDCHKLTRFEEENPEESPHEE